jgi:hypothetical protein
MKVLAAWMLGPGISLLAAQGALAADLAPNDVMVPKFLLDEPATTPATASRFTGYVEGGFEAGSSRDTDLDSHSWRLRGSMNASSDTGLNLQADADYAHSYLQEFGWNDNIGGTLHVYYRPDSNYAVGVFGQTGRFESRFLPDTTARDYLGGLEAAWLGTDMTIYGQAGLGTTDIGGFDYDHYAGRAGMRYFFTDNIRADAEVAFDRYQDDVETADVWKISAIGNYRPDGTPVSFYAGYRFEHAKLSVDGFGSDSDVANNFLVGMRYHFGSSSLKDEEGNGPIWRGSSF